MFEDVRGKFGFGCMRLPMRGEEVDQEEFNKMVDAFLGAGFNYFDTAHPYINGLSEGAMRKAIVDRHNRDEYLIADKLSAQCFSHASEVDGYVRNQLEILGVDYIDYYLIHGMNAMLLNRYESDGTFEEVKRVKEKGLIKHLGISFHDSAEVLEKILVGYPEIEFVQIQFNYCDYDDGILQSRALYDVCVKYHKPCVIMEPIKGGKLVSDLPQEALALVDELGLSPAALALKFVANFENNYVILSGVSTLAQMEENIKTFDNLEKLNEKETKAIEQIVKIIKSKNLIQCTACRYCTAGCPRGINIPDLFACMNGVKQFNEWVPRVRYGALTADNNRASDCIKCGQCENICPQHLKIIDLLASVAKEFEQ